ncbi:hypothetical protein evm_009483 [Chilo suppressalis]|nr:hypothetical protein evm_009483 [Chilo suppressalis]
MGGCTKTVQQWQTVWFDRKHLAKKAAADCRRSASATGGGPSTAPQLTHWELKVLSIMGERFGERKTGARVPAFDEELELNPPNELTEPTQQAEPSRQDSLTSQRFSQSRSGRRRRQVSGNGIGSRLLQIEGERKDRETLRNSELAGIKNALLELKAAVLEFCAYQKKT